MKLVFLILTLFNNGVPTNWDITAAFETMENCQSAAHKVFAMEKDNIPEGMQLQVKCVDFAPVPLLESGFGVKRVVKPAPGEKTSER